MTTNLVLKSANSMYYAGGKAQFKVNWAQFMSDPNAEYLVSFSFITAVDGGLNENDLYVLDLENIGVLKNIEGGNFNSSTSRTLGFVYPEEPHSSHSRIRAEYSTNPPVSLCGRPTSDILEIAWRDLTGALSSKSPAFVLCLRFEMVGKY